MTTAREGHVVASLAMLVASQTVLGQNSLDLEEADARNAAYTIMRAAEEQFACELKEHSVREIGYEPGSRFLFYITAEGDECREALIFVTEAAARADKVMFRQVGPTIERVGEPLFIDDQVLIHKVNPGVDDTEDPGD